MPRFGDVATAPLGEQLPMAGGCACSDAAAEAGEEHSCACLSDGDETCASAESGSCGCFPEGIPSREELAELKTETLQAAAPERTPVDPFSNTSSCCAPSAGTPVNLSPFSEMQPQMSATAPADDAPC